MGRPRAADPGLNPVWVAFCSSHITEWLEWLRAIHLPSYLELSTRFILLHPYYIPIESDRQGPYGQTLERLMLDEEFIHSLSDRGLLVWANSGVPDFITTLTAYQSYPEIAQVIGFLHAHISWFHRVYAYLRAELIADLREAGRNI